MKNEIDLVSPEAKRKRLRRLYKQRLTYLARRIVLVWFIFLAMLGGAFGYVVQRQRALAAQLAQEQGDSRQTADEVQRVNALLGVIYAWVESRAPWTPVLDDVIRAVPATVRLEVLAVQPDGGALFIRGVSSSRAAVVDMQQAFEELPWVERVEAPLQNFAAGEVNEFSFTLIRHDNENQSSE